MSIKYYVFYLTLCADLRKKVDLTIEIYIAKSSIVINFNMIHHKYRGDPLQRDLKTYHSVQKKTFLGTINRKRKILFHLPYVTNVKIFLSKRQLLTNILRACNAVFFFRFI